MKKSSILICGILAAASIFAMSACSGGASSSAASPSSEASSSAASPAASSDGQASEVVDSQQNETPDIDTEGEEYISTVRKMYEGAAEYESLPSVLIETTMGNVTVRLFPDEAPKAVENFLTHAKQGYYDGVTFHRVINNFMIQGGDPTATGRGGESIWGEPFQNEYGMHMFAFRGCLAMANSGTPTSNGSQFFIVQNPDLANSGVSVDMLEQMQFPSVAREIYEENGGYPSLDFVNPQQGIYGYTYFGYVTEGMDVIDAIAAVETDDSDKPVEDVKIVKMTVNE